MARSPLLAGLVVPLILLASGAAADPEADQLREQLRATVLQLRQLQDQQASAPQPAAAPGGDATLKASLAALRARLRAAQRRAVQTDQLKADFDKAQIDKAALTAAVAASAAETAALKTANAQAADQIRALTADRDATRARLVLMTTIARACQAKNDKLTVLSRALIDRLAKVSVADAMVREEPFLGLARTRLENITQDRDDALRAARCDPALDAVPARPAG